ncbi:Methionine--tRNA ligase, partial [Clarias magur]
EQKLYVRENEEVLLIDFSVTQMSVFGLRGYYPFPANKYSLDSIPWHQIHYDSKQDKAYN